MPKRRLDQYKGKLNPAQIAAGMNEAAVNAKRLHGDAKLLLDNGRFPSAVSLASLSIEESGKQSILRSLALARDQKELAETWREYRSHARKNTMWPFMQMFLQGARRLSDFRPLVEEGAEHPFLLDNVKQLGFYTDCLGKSHWSVPTDVIDEKLAREIVRIAEFLLPKRGVTEREIELWIEHLQPVWKQPMERMEAGLDAWHRQMCAEGLSDGDPDSIEKFILDGIGPEVDNGGPSNKRDADDG